MFLKVNNIAKSFGQQVILSDITFEVSEGITLSVLGKSGCGKTTLLKVLAGLVRNDTGAIYLNNRNITNANVNARDIVYMYQEPLLFPHLNVFDNIAFGLHIRKVNKIQLEKEVNLMLEALGLSEHKSKFPSQLSGGQKQRVAFGRAIIVNPKLLLLDEPFGNLDTETRVSMQQFFLKTCSTFGITSIFVTHDLKEALTVGSKLGYMVNGNLFIYDDRQSFINDNSTGVQNEIAFWQNL